MVMRLPTIALNNLRSQIKSTTSQTKLHICCKRGLWIAHMEKASFVSLDDLDNISSLLDEDNDLEYEINHLFDKVSISIFKFEKKHNQSGSKYTQNIYRNTG